MSKRDIVAIGGSAGSAAALRKIVAALPLDFSGSVFVTVHIPTTQPSHLAEVLGKSGELPVAIALDGQPIERGQIYVAPMDRHMLLMNGAIRLGAGPRENLVRPSIDPMFRSAAMSFGSRVIGVVLSGLLNDGASGLFAIKSAGGVAIVQHPLDAQESSMPRAALEAVDVDHAARADELGELIASLARTEAGPSRAVPDSVAFEVKVACGGRVGSDTLHRFASPATLTCPECGGVLSEVQGEKPLRFRCQIGHAYTAEELADHHELLDEAIGVAMRIMEERVTLVRRMAQDARETGRKAVAELYDTRAAEYRRYADTLRQAAQISMAASREANEDAA
ncbi:MAG: chemotaxis protein CheB [Caulobacteraceae bacterium]|nr:chemotaxis protein CheB [Caulobacteraceae bacterium]